MIPRTGFIAISLPFVAATGMVVYSLHSVTAQSQMPRNPFEGQGGTPATSPDAQPAAGSAIQRELDALYAQRGEQAPVMTPSAAAGDAASESAQPARPPVISAGRNGQMAQAPKQPPRSSDESSEIKPTSFWRRFLPGGGSSNASRPQQRTPSSKPSYGRLNFANTVKNESEYTGRSLDAPSSNSDQPSSMAGSQATAPPSGMASQNGMSNPARPGSIQQQLEEMYRRDGRQMPPMAGGTQQQARAAESIAPETPAPKTSLARKLLPFLPDNDPAPQVPADEAAGEAKPRLFPGFRGLAQKKPEQPEKPEQASKEIDENGPEIAKTEVAPPAANPGEYAPAGDFVDPFTEVSEVEADTMADLADVNPFTGLTLDAEESAVVPTHSTSPFAAPLPPLPSDTAVADVEDLPPASEMTPTLTIPCDEYAGLNGFCPVALRDNRVLVSGSPEFAVIYRNRMIKLSSEEAINKFELRPDQYLPIFDGHDVVLKANFSDEVDGSLDYAVWFKDRLYLFQSQQTLDTFSESPNRYAMPGSSESSEPEAN